MNCEETLLSGAPVKRKQQRSGIKAVCIAVGLSLVLGLAALDVYVHVHRGQEIEALQEAVGLLMRDVGRIQTEIEIEIEDEEYEREEDLVEGQGKAYGQVLSRLKRQISHPPNLGEDGLPSVGRSYSGNNDAQNTEGLRIYDAWFQHRNNHEIPQMGGATMNGFQSIMPHHRKSASWVEKPSHNLNTHFDKTSAFRDSYPKAEALRKTAAASQEKKVRNLPSRAKFTKSNNSTSSTFSSSASSSSGYQVSGALPVLRVVHPNPATTSRPAPTNSFSSEFKTSMSGSMAARAARNRAATRSMGRKHLSHRQKMGMKNKNLRRSRFRSESSISSQFQGLKAVHYVGDMERTSARKHGYGGVGLSQNEQGGAYRRWAPARWASRLGTHKEFPMSREGKMRISEAGLYYVYAQINYLDEHDVNAYQIFANDDAFLLCTVMTHTNQQTTKANTCYTGGVRFLQRGDELHIRDLETGRFSVLLPAHTFFGIIQLTSMKP